MDLRLASGLVGKRITWKTMHDRRSGRVIKVSRISNCVECRDDKSPHQHAIVNLSDIIKVYE